MLNLPFALSLALLNRSDRRLAVRSGLVCSTVRITAGVTAAMLALAMEPTEVRGQSMESVTNNGEVRPRQLNDGVTGQRVPSQQAPFSPGGLPSQTDIFGISSSYRLGIGDVIGVSVFGAEEYGAEVIVLQDGTVNLPRIGQVFVLGQTLREAETTLAQRYATFIRQPMVSIASVSLRPVRIAIAGAVRKPGSYTVQRAVETRDNNIFDSRFPTLTEAIAQAGGITGKANIREIELRRPVGYNDYEVRTFDLWDLIQTSDLTQDVVLQSGDEVFVPTAVAMLPSEANAIADASFAPEAINVYVAGEVDSPGFQQLPLNSPLNQAILTAGNFNPRANRSVVQLVRVNPDGTVTQREINVDLAAGVNDGNNPILTEEDVIIVGRSGLTRFGDATSIVLSPVTQILNTILGLENLLFD
jgi:polysaccharide export outer membrane protein